MTKQIWTALMLMAWGGGALAQQWTYVEMNPNDPPYLSGAATQVTSRDGTVRMDYTCTSEGSTLMLTGGVVERLPSPAYISFLIDGWAQPTIEMTEYEGALFAQPPAALLDAFAAGSLVDVYLVGTTNNFTSFPLRGSSAALRAARANCR